jgi:hypothetical protein
MKGHGGAPATKYRSWRRAQQFLIESGWLGLGFGGLPIPAAVWGARLGVVAALGPLGGLAFALAIVCGGLALPLAILWAALAGAALLHGAERARRFSTGDDILSFRESGAYTLLHGAALLMGGVATGLGVLLVAATAAR